MVIPSWDTQVNSSEVAKTSESPQKSDVNGSLDDESALSTEMPTEVSTRRSSKTDSTLPISGSTKESDSKVAHRRRQWGSQSSDRTNSSVPSFSSDTLEKLVPTLTAGSDQKLKTVLRKPTVDSSNVKLDLTACGDSGDKNMHNESQKSTNVIDAVKTSVTRGDVDANATMPSRNGANAASSQKHSTNSTNAVSTKTVSTKRKGPKETKAVGYLIEAPERIDPCAPAKHRPTNIVYIRSLVRPFTADQLRQMISERFGTVSDLWLDRIKSSSLVRFDSIESATRCREGLDGCRWPSMNPHALHCDFGSDQLFTWMQEHGNSGEHLPPKYLVLGEKPLEEQEPGGAGGKKKSDMDNKAHHELKNADRHRGKADRPDGDVLPCKDTHGKEAPDVKRRFEEPARLLDDLFKKTATTPCIYWLPLTAEQAEKQAVERAKLLQANPPITARPPGRPFTQGPTGPKQRATRSPFTSPVVPEKTSAETAPTRSSSSHRSSGVKTHSSEKSECKDQKTTSVRNGRSPVQTDRTNRRSRSRDARNRRNRLSTSPRRTGAQPSATSKSRERRPTPPSYRSGVPAARRRDPTPPSPPRPRMIRRSTSSRSRSNSSRASRRSLSSSRSRSHSRNRTDARRGKASYRISRRPRSRSGRRHASPVRARR